MKSQEDNKSFKRRLREEYDKESREIRRKLQSEKIVKEIQNDYPQNRRGGKEICLQKELLCERLHKS